MLVELIQAQRTRKFVAESVMVPEEPELLVASNLEETCCLIKSSVVHKIASLIWIPSMCLRQ